MYIHPAYLYLHCSPTCTFKASGPEHEYIGRSFVDVAVGEEDEYKHGEVVDVVKSDSFSGVYFPFYFLWRVDRSKNLAKFQKFDKAKPKKYIIYNWNAKSPGRMHPLFKGHATKSPKRRRVQ